MMLPTGKRRPRRRRHLYRQECRQRLSPGASKPSLHIHSLALPTVDTAARPERHRRRVSTYHAADLHLRCARRPDLLTRGDHPCTHAAALHGVALHGLNRRTNACLHRPQGPHHAAGGAQPAAAAAGLLLFLMRSRRRPRRRPQAGRTAAAALPPGHWPRQLTCRSTPAVRSSCRRRSCSKAANTPAAGPRRHPTPSPLRAARRVRERVGDNRSGGGRTGSARSWPESRRCGSCPPPGHGRRRRPAPALEAPTGLLHFPPIAQEKEQQI
ncbi:hypothetical protein PVAP13_2KG500905 [Panicum virgatum]|uniref:Uncharacterized protein n=1 Tax=Panicum virgatum TaxID=38727 RepID=A0A8T0WJS7_PANVG|nr:hypothetical protein PVAP13_2KG500905 [Panicum virgatum]